MRVPYPAKVAGMAPLWLAIDPPKAEPAMRPPEYTATAMDATAAGSPKPIAESAKSGNIAPIPISARRVGKYTESAKARTAARRDTPPLLSGGLVLHDDLGFRLGIEARRRLVS